MSTVVRLGNGFRFYVKGAPEILFPLCTQQLSDSGSETLTSDDRVCWHAYSAHCSPMQLCALIDRVLSLRHLILFCILVAELHQQERD
jgi:hypothetical protein